VKTVAVFRVDTENRQRRIEMDQIAVINTARNEVKPHEVRPLLRSHITCDEADGAARSC
jgi:hypothetical protein